MNTHQSSVIQKGPQKCVEAYNQQNEPYCCLHRAYSQQETDIETAKTRNMAACT
ncbi:hypothetical protein STEG23_009171, partial [Scotinomys teguina]